MGRPRTAKHPKADHAASPEEGPQQHGRPEGGGEARSNPLPPGRRSPKGSNHWRMMSRSSSSVSASR
jgi:hypothetical protein